MFGWLDTLFFYDWTVSPETWDFRIDSVPQEYRAGALVKTYEVSDPQTVILHLRQGVLFQNKAPVNGREFIADDVVQHFDRLLGKGSYTKPDPLYMAWLYNYESVTAKDKYTVVVKFKAPGAMNELTVKEMPWNQVEAPETVKDGPITDWHNAVGTGPWILTDLVANTTMTFEKNPTYWGYDDRHPKNRLPYADVLKVQCIPDLATALAALRTGKIDIITAINWQQAESVAASNPELVQEKLPTNGATLDIRCDMAPFTDINVRKALQMAVNRNEIAKSYYHGTTEGTPVGIISLSNKGYYTPYAQWPKELQEEYSYNPTRAKELLAAAGFPDGFKTNVVANSATDLALLQVLQDEFKDINVEMEIRTMDPTTFQAYVSAGKHDQLCWTSSSCGVTWPPARSVDQGHSKKATNYTHNNDPVYDALVEKMGTTLDATEPKRLSIECDMYALSHHWRVNVIPINTFNIFQPYLKGYNGEGLTFGETGYFARWWVDQKVKTSMGR